MLDEATKDEIFSYVETVVENANFWEYEIKFSVKQERSSYGGDGILAVAHVAGEDHRGRELFLDLTIKMSDKTTEDDHVRKVYKREIFFFRNIMPYLVKFLVKKKIFVPLLVPYCHKVISTKEREVLIFNNLIELGYKPQFTSLTVNRGTLYFILNSLAKFHAVSFAVRNEQPEKFEEILLEWTPAIKDIFLNLDIELKLKTGLQMALDMLSEENRTDLKAKLAKDIENGVSAVINNVLSNVPDESVIVHGDMWMDHIFILYEKDNPEVPKSMKLTYWNLSALHSPVLDLGYFLYFTYSEDVQLNFESYVEYYYNEFSNLLIQLGTDAVQFSFLTLLDHWKKYSIMPLVIALGGIPLVLANKHLNICTEDYESLEYSSLEEDIKHLIKTKLLGILELHYKYFGD